MQLSGLQSQSVFSLNPLFAEQSAILVPGSEGSWALYDFDTIVVKKTGDNFYLLKFGTANNPSQYEAVFTSLNNTTILDLVPKIPENTGGKEYRKQFNPLHSFLKINIEKDTAWAAFLNYAWFYNQLRKNKNLLPHSWREGGLVITATPSELRNFIESHVYDSAFFDNPFPLSRLSSLKNSPAATLNKSTMNGLVNAKQKCLPAFPLKDGWLGGDGDVSLSINENKSLFLFSDTYVGQKNEHSRAGNEFTMVSNSVGVATCDAKGKYNIRYYWKDMYSQNPKPVFESLTNRFYYWINDAFLHSGNMYVLALKVGSITGPAPGENIFNFSIMGNSLAKVTDPVNVRPDQWRSELIPFTFFDAARFYIHSLAKDDNYLYLFTDKDVSQTVLLRLPLDSIDSPQGHIEYYSQTNSWKQGTDTADMMIILPERPGNTINYHPDIRKWVMVCGPGFLENRIRLRTATQLTGPWSEGVTVYECPETIPGKPEYHKTNFCYLGREVFQNYDESTRTMYISYDTNNSDFSAIKANPKIYTPKIISISFNDFGIR